jgi:hypothetical protein
VLQLEVPDRALVRVLREPVELHLPAGIPAFVVALLRGHPAGRLRGVLDRCELLERSLGLLDVVVHGSVVLTDTLLAVGLVLAATAGTAQVFSP